MKQFIFNDFNKNGTPFVIITASFDSVKGLQITEENATVSISPQTAPADGCDFIGSGSSRCSEEFYELNGCPTICNFRFGDTTQYTIKKFVYCLPENKDIVVDAMTTHFKAWLQKELQKQIDSAQQALSLVA